MRRLLGISAAVILALSALAVPATAATTWVVDCGAGADLQAAIDAASPGDTLRISGTCVGNFHIDFGKPLTLEGSGTNPTIKGAAGSTAPVLDVSGATVIDLTITGGAGDGIKISGEEFTLWRSHVTDNARMGIYLYYGHLTLDQSTIEGNGDRGIVCCSHPGGFDITESVIRHNATGGIHNNMASTVTDSTIRENAGGGIYNASSSSGRGQLTLVRSTVIGNTLPGGRGGGIYNAHELTIIDSVVRGNTADKGGGIYNAAWPDTWGVHGVLTIRDSQVVYNDAGIDGGGLYNEPAAELVLDSATIAHNTPNDCVGCPLTLSGISASDITRAAATITWTVSEKATGQVEYGTTESYGSWSTKETSYTYSTHSQRLTGLDPGTTYHYRVHSGSADGRTVTSADRSFTTLAPALTLSGVSATGISDSAATIGWTVSEPATGQVEYGTSTAYGSWSEAETSYTYSSHVQRLTGLAADTTYHYRVHSGTADGRSVSSADRTFTTLAAPRPPNPCPAPSLVSPPDGARLTSHTLTLDWDAVGGCTFGRYLLRVRTSSDMTADAPSLVEAYTAPGTTVWSGAIAGHEGEDLYWAVTADQAPDGASWSGVRSFRIVPPARTTKTVDDLSAGFDHGGSGWHAAASGYLRHLYWVSPSGSRGTRWGEWTAALGGGWYRVAVYVPARHATSRSAAYRVYAAGGSTVVMLDQAAEHGRWVTLGVFEFGGRGTVRLTSATGEAVSGGRRLAFDAVRFVPLSAAAATDATRQPTADPGSRAVPVPEPTPGGG